MFNFYILSLIYFPLSALTSKLFLALLFSKFQKGAGNTQFVLSIA